MKTKVCALALPLVLAACGGGGGGDAGSSVFTGTPVTSTTYNVAAAQHALLTTGKSWSTTGTAAGQTYSYSLTYQPLAAGVFSLTGGSGSRTQESLTFSSNLGSSSATTILYSNATTDAPLGQLDVSSGACTRIVSHTALPAAATVGSSGPFHADSTLSSCDSTGVVMQTDTVTWSLETENGIVFVCQNDTASNVAGSYIPGTLNICLEISPDGTLGNRARITVDIPGISLSLVTRNY